MPPLNEFAMIDRLLQQQRSGQGGTPAATEVGIGDDAAVLSMEGPDYLLVTVDMLMEGVHFTDPPATPGAIGRKSLAVNLSDIAAMGGVPTHAFVAIGLPRQRGAEWGMACMDGIGTLATEFGVAITGGDTNIWDGPLVVSITLHGRTTGHPPVLRSGAKPGDWLMVTGALGGSLQGRHLNFLPRIREAQSLLERADLHAMLDLSDGLATDLPRIAHASNVGFVIDASAIPIHADVDSQLLDDQRLHRALTDGEDFELLFCVDGETGAALLNDPEFAPWLTHIGVATGESGSIFLRTPDGHQTLLPHSGYEHRF